MADHKGKRVVITGASSGIGAETAAAFYRAGAYLVLSSRSEERVKKAVSVFADPEDPRILIMACDTADPGQIDLLAEEAAKRFGGIDIWVNNAGIEHPCPTVEMTPEIFDQVVNTNFRGYFFGCRAAARDMLLRGEHGVIINIGSVNAVTVVVGQAVYAGTKAAISQITKSFAREWGGSGIRVNCVAPGSIPTGINEAKYRDPEAVRAMCGKIPMGRRGQKSEIADVVLYLASDQASYITGQTIFVDGGLTLCHG